MKFEIPAENLSFYKGDLHISLGHKGCLSAVHSSQHPIMIRGGQGLGVPGWHPNAIYCIGCRKGLSREAKIMLALMDLKYKRDPNRYVRWEK